MVPASASARIDRPWAVRLHQVAAYRALLGQLEEQEVDDEAVFAALETLRSSIIRTADLLEAEQRSD